MELIILLIIVIGAVCFFRKKRKAKEEKKLSTPIEVDKNISSFSLFAKTQEEILEQKTKCQEFINTNEELNKIYNQVYNCFIPKANGDYNFGVLTFSNDARCKQLEKANEIVTRICNGNKSQYNAFFMTLYDCILNDMYSSKIQKLSNFAKKIIKDYENGNKLVVELGIMDALLEFVANPSAEKHEVKTDVGPLFKKIKFIAKRKKGKMTYEIKNLYQYSPYGYNLLDPLVRTAEILITICDWYEHYRPSDKIKMIGPLKESLEKYNLPNISW